MVDNNTKCTHGNFIDQCDHVQCIFHSGAVPSNESLRKEVAALEVRLDQYAEALAALRVRCFQLEKERAELITLTEELKKGKI